MIWCHFDHNAEAVVKVQFIWGGCLCYPNDPVQFLCEEHLRKGEDQQDLIILEELRPRV